MSDSSNTTGALEFGWILDAWSAIEAIIPAACEFAIPLSEKLFYQHFKIPKNHH